MFSNFFEVDLTARRYLIAALEGFMRFMGVLLLIIGLSQALNILGVSFNPDETFLGLSVAKRFSLVFFTIFNLIAAVGLWNKMSWGAVVWLISVFVDFVMQISSPATFGFAPFSLLFHLITVAIYAILISMIRKHSIK